jgi:hypothetical protein
VSYDLYLVPRDGAGDWQRWLEDEAEDGSPPTDEERTQMRRLADAVRAAEPALERADDTESITLTHPDDKTPIEVSIFRRSAGLNIPYWQMGEPARVTVGKALGLMKAVASEADWVAFDPQLDRRVDPDLDLEAILLRYEEGTAQVRELTGEGQKKKRRLWPFGRRAAR